MSERPFSVVYRPGNPEGVGRGHALGLRGVTRVGVWDLGALVGFLPDVFAALNRAQTEIVFLNLHAAVPMGLRQSPDAMVQWLRHWGLRVTKKRRVDMRANFLADPYFAQADHLRRALRLNYIVGLTPLMLAGSDPLPYWNYLGTSRGASLLVSTYEVPQFAQRAKRPFEVSVAMLISSLVLNALNPHIIPHLDTRGCLFDFNESRESLVTSLRAMDIDDECRNNIRPRFRRAALAITQALREYRGPRRAEV